MIIETMVGIDDYTLLVYRCADKMYRFSIANENGNTYTCNSSFPTLSSAKFMGVSAIERANMDRQNQ